MTKYPIPTYRADEFMGKTHVAGLNDVDRLLFALWITRAKLCKNFDYEKYFAEHPDSKQSTILMIGNMTCAKMKCMRMAERYGDTSNVKI